MKRYPKYNQNQLTRTVVLEVFNVVALKYWTVDRFIYWLIKKAAEVLEGTDPGDGAFALILRPHPGAFSQLMCPQPGESAHFFLNANARGLAPGRGAWALLELTDA